MRKINLRAALLIAGVALAAPLGATFAYAEMTKMVGGAPMYPSKNIVQNAVHSKDHTTLVAAVKAAGLVPTLEGAGPFTVLAPTNAAFAKLPAGTVKTLLEPANKGQLTAVLTYHVIPGRITAAEPLQEDRRERRPLFRQHRAGRRAVVLQDERRHRRHRRQGRHRDGDDPRRHAVERRHPRHQRRAAAGLIDRKATRQGRGSPRPLARWNQPSDRTLLYDLDDEGAR